MRIAAGKTFRRVPPSTKRAISCAISPSVSASVTGNEASGAVLRTVAARWRKSASISVAVKRRVRFSCGTSRMIGPAGGVAHADRAIAAMAGRSRTRRLRCMGGFT
ncbi:MAG: hypothetical protein LW860_10300 [Xanthomonadaceae bacterium]|nr:hypothetical protein [Xanthomonadaceae bacterium]